MIRVGLVGLGRIGIGYDLDRDDLVLSHCKAIFASDQFEMVWIAESDKNLHGRVNAYGFSAARVFVALPAIPVDLIVIAVPSADHLAVVRQALNLNPKAILCEKPAGGGSSDTELISQLSDDHGVPIYVNYMRRCEPGVVQLKADIAQGRYGEFYKAVCWYSGGLRNNGSHFIDLLQYWFGDIAECKALECKALGEGDPDVDFMLRFCNGLKVYFVAGKEQCFGSKELELLSDRGSLRYLRGGFDIALHTAQTHEKFAGYLAYGLRGEKIENDYCHFMAHVYSCLAMTILNGDPFPATIESACRTQEIADQIITLTQAQS